MEKSRNNTWVCIASGPSLNQTQIDLIGRARKENRCTVLGINTNWVWKYEDEFVCDHLYAADPQLWTLYIDEMNDAGFKGEKWIPINTKIAKSLGLNVVNCVYTKGFPDTKKSSAPIHCMHHSGAQAIQLAWKKGAKKIILVGFDMKTGPKGKIHWFGSYTKKGLRNTPDAYDRWIAHHKVLKQGFNKIDIDVVNCSIETAIPFYRRSDLHKELFYR